MLVLTLRAVRSVAAGRRRRCCGLALLLLQAMQAQAQAQPQPQPQEPAPLPLKSSELLQEFIAPATRNHLPSFVSGNFITGRPDLETVVQGNAMLRKGDMVIKADNLEYNQPTDLAKARGHVLVNRAGNVYEGPLLELRVDAFEGFFNQPDYHFLRNEAHGQAERVDFLDDQRAVIRNATYTTCKRLPGPSWMPDWILKASTLSLDNEEDIGTAEGALLSFKGVPLLPIPYLTFPLTDQRKSGLLPFSAGFDSVNGPEVSVPYYWNIAPNRDATITPTLMSKRGLNLNTQFRYLESAYSGSAQLDWMPSDTLRDANRWNLSAVHQGQLASAWSDSGVALNLNLNRVSDNNYWRDFTRANVSQTQRLLANDATLAWTNGPFASRVRTLKWQTLQDATSPITPPYDILPQLNTRYTRVNLRGFDLAVEADYSQFQSTASSTGQPNAQRLFSLAQLSRTWRAPAGYVTPKLQLHATQYQFDAALANGASQASRVVPTFSVDSGLVFERDAQLFGHNLNQTLEPRAYYVNTPYRDQSMLPNYDSGANGLSLGTIFTENAFVGNDRISDSNLLTLGVTTRFLRPDSGAELLRFDVTQGLRLRDQNVTLPGGAPVVDRISDVYLGAAINWDPRWGVGAAMQFSPKTEQTERATLDVRYQPGSYRTVTAAFRYQRNATEQLDLGWQWPLNDLWGARGLDKGVGQGQGEGRWYSVGRLNYSLKDGQTLESVLGFEYDAGCWLGRIVVERVPSSTTLTSQRIMFQLEFVGFTRLGVNNSLNPLLDPLKHLREKVPNYQNLREPAGLPSRFSNYD